MSIDTSKITGWSDSVRGNVTQITDAAGRVLWSSAPPFDGFVYLRPSADISIDSTITLVPEGATSAYMLINEEVCDGDATKITYSSQSLGSATATFSLAGTVPKTISRVTNIRIYVAPAFVNTNKYCGLYCSLTINTTEYKNYLPTESGANDYELKELALTTEGMLAEINDYVSANGVLPNFEMSLEFYVEPPDNGNVPKDGMTISVSQAYVILECE